MWWAWIPDHQHEIYAYLREHIALTVLSVGFGIVIALPLAVLSAARPAPVAAVVVPVVNAVYTIPSVALLGLLLPITGTGREPAVIALTLYSLVILVRNTLEGLRGVPADVLDAADGMGYTRRRRLLRGRAAARAARDRRRDPARDRVDDRARHRHVHRRPGRARAGSSRTGTSATSTRRSSSGIVLSVALAVVADLVLVRLERAVTPWRRTAR